MFPAKRRLFPLCAHFFFSNIKYFLETKIVMGGPLLLSSYERSLPLLLLRHVIDVERTFRASNKNTSCPLRQKYPDYCKKCAPTFLGSFALVIRSVYSYFPNHLRGSHDAYCFLRTVLTTFFPPGAYFYIGCRKRTCYFRSSGSSSLCTRVRDTTRSPSVITGNISIATFENALFHTFTYFYRRLVMNESSLSMFLNCFVDHP